MASSKKNSDIMKLDLYSLLNIAENANPKQIKKAYRIKALQCHPDKNPDNPKAAELFHQLAEALKILSDVGARAAYDHLRRARKAAKERTERLDSQRKKVKLDLEARERAAEEIEKKQAKTTLKQEIERLRDEGSRILEDEQRRMREEMKAEQKIADSLVENSSKPAQVKVKWKSSKDDPTNGGYSEEVLKKMFAKYGEVTALLLSKKKRGTAIVEFRDGNAARLAVEMELGSPANPLKISWLSGRPEVFPSSDQNTATFRPPDGAAAMFKSNPSFSSSATTPSNDDFEAVVLQRLQREQERRRALAKDLEDDGD